MRSKVLVASALTAFVAATLAACGSGGSPSSPATVPNNIGGGTSPITPQARSGASFLARLLDGGTAAAAYLGLNVTAVETETTNDAGSDVLFNGSTAPGSSTAPQPYPVPTNPVGTHLLTFNGNGLTDQIFTLNVPSLQLSTDLTLPPLAGQTTPSVYPALAFYAAVTLVNGTVPTFDIEITGGSTTSQYDVRVACANASLLLPNQNVGAVGPTVFARYVCVLPSYGAPSGSYVTNVSSSGNGAITGISYLGPPILNAAAPGATGVFTPSTTNPPGSLSSTGQGTPGPNFANQPALSIVLDENPTGTNFSGQPGVPLSLTTTGNTLEIDYLYAEGLLE